MPRSEAYSSLRSPRIGAWLAAAKSMSATGSVLPSKVEPLGVGLTLVDYCLMTYASLKSEPADSTDFFRVWGCELASFSGAARLKACYRVATDFWSVTAFWVCSST